MNKIKYVVIMKNPKNSIKSTVVLNKNNSDGFLDFNSSHDLSEAINALNKIKKGGDKG